MGKKLLIVTKTKVMSTFFSVSGKTNSFDDVLGYDQCDEYEDQTMASLSTKEIKQSPSVANAASVSSQESSASGSQLIPIKSRRSVISIDPTDHKSIQLSYIVARFTLQCNLCLSDVVQSYYCLIKMLTFYMIFFNDNKREMKKLYNVSGFEQYSIKELSQFFIRIIPNRNYNRGSVSVKAFLQKLRRCRVKHDWSAFEDINWQTVDNEKWQQLLTAAMEVNTIEIAKKRQECDDMSVSIHTHTDIVITDDESEGSLRKFTVYENDEDGDCDVLCNSSEDSADNDDADVHSNVSQGHEHVDDDDADNVDEVENVVSNVYQGHQPLDDDDEEDDSGASVQVLSGVKASLKESATRRRSRRIARTRRFNQHIFDSGDKYAPGKGMVSKFLYRKLWEEHEALKAKMKQYEAKMKQYGVL